MKKINQFSIFVILIALLINPVFGYPGMGGNNSGAIGNNTQSAQDSIDLANATQSDQNIFLRSHLIEVDAVRLESENKIIVRETQLFKNVGDQDFMGSLRTWVPSGLEGINVGRVAMVSNSIVEPLEASQNGNILSWQDYLEKNDPLPSMYVVEYVYSAEPVGTLIKSRYLTKKLVSPTQINKLPEVVILKVTMGVGETVTIRDDLKSSITSSGNERKEEDNSVIYTWEAPQFREINIELSKSSIDLSQMGLYLIIGLFIVLVFTYPVIRKKSAKLQEIEEKIRSSFSKRSEEEEVREEDEETRIEEPSEEEEETEKETEEEKEEAPPEDQDLSGKTKDELETQKNELLSKLDQLEKDYASGNLIDEEYEDLKNSYQQKLRNIDRQIERT